jgi:hypothetical protein
LVQTTQVTVTRLKQNPLITVDTSSSLGGNVNGPTVIRVPDWIEHPLGRYYMYFANHVNGQFVRMAYADAIAGPWKIHEPGVLHVRDTALTRPGSDSAPPRYFNHVASPEIFVDAARKRLVLWVHGWWTNGEAWPTAAANVDAWMAQKGYAQRTQVAESSDGIHFEARPAITSAIYLRVFPFGGYLYGIGDVELSGTGRVARGSGGGLLPTEAGLLVRSAEPLATFDIGLNPFRDSAYEGRTRHFAFVRRGNRLHVFLTAVGDAPERVLLSTIELSPDWTSWRASPPIEVLQPETAYECSDLSIAPSRGGNAPGKVRQIRDPSVFEENGRLFLFYSICGESGRRCGNYSPLNTVQRWSDMGLCFA